MVASRFPFLGELELAVMDTLWRQGEAEVNAIHDAVGRARGITPNTVQSTMKRLHDKGLLTRRKVSHAYVYSPACTRAEFHAGLIGEIVGGLMDDAPDATLAAFVDLTERAGAEHLARLERMVAARMAQSTKETP